MRKNRLSILFGVLFILLFGLPAASPVVAEDGIHIKFSTWHPPASREVKTVWAPMLEELNKRSNGRITFTLYAGGALGTGPEHYDIVAQGLSDMGYFTATWTPGRFPLTDVLSLAAWVDGKDVGVEIGNATYRRILKDEFPDVKVLELNGCIQAFLWTKKPIRTLEDCKGLRLRTPGGHQTRYIHAIGAEPVFMPLGDVYLAVETGAIDGLVTCPPLVLAFKLPEVIQHGVILTFGCVSEGVVMNRRSWEKTPDDLKPIIEEVVGNPFKTTHGLNQEVYRTMMKEIEKKGVSLYRLPQDEEQRWFKVFQDETRKWVAELEAKGLPARKAVDIFAEEAHKHGVECVAYPSEWKD
ncbi:TRAP transporter substrate-binding protein [Desulfatiglans anilini]|uniref:TRAP transporter substrate-binding protein n=1 Tax=Desulfatiglans anilini TaxID=90728 RepID=UPI00042A1BC6|nr:TRAP transporter substrate-binding protein [Desulfatiglans anilini]